MALTDAEIVRCKAELGYNLLEIGAIPYIGITPIFEGVVQPYLNAGAVTTSSTTVVAADEPTAVTLTLVSATGFALFDRAVVDVDDNQETATVRATSGATITLLLRKAHSGTYPVTVEGGESIVREILGYIRGVKTELAQTYGEGSLKQVDEIAFYQTGGTQFGNLGQQLMAWRDELAAALGVASMWAQRKAGAQRLAVY